MSEFSNSFLELNRLPHEIPSIWNPAHSWEDYTVVLILLIDLAENENNSL